MPYNDCKSEGGHKLALTYEIRKPRKVIRGQLTTLIKRSGLTVEEFAELVLARHERTVRRWMVGDSPIPKVVCRWIMRQPEVEREADHVSTLIGRR